MAKIWVISDNHFGHENMYKFTTSDGSRIRGLFNSAKEGDEFMIDQWNQLVRPEDHVYHCGDFAMKAPDIKFAWKLKGHKRLILGNHDNPNMKLYLEAGFQKIFGMKHNSGVWFTHAPMHWDIAHQAKFLGNVHGHIHQNPSPTKAHFNACVEWTGYKPVELDEIIEVFRKRKANGYR